MTAFNNQLAQYPKLEVDFQADSEFKLNTLVMTPMETKSWIHRLIDKNEFLNRRFATVSMSPKFPQSCISLCNFPLFSGMFSYSEARNLTLRKDRRA